MQITLFLYVGFFLLGIVGVILGPLLPDLEARWEIGHAEVAVLFLAQFGASSIGAVLSTINLRVSLMLCYPLLASGLAILAAGSWSTAPLGLGLVGLGFGLCLPSSNLLVAEAYPTRRGAALSRLNMIWGLGAVTCPLLLLALAGHLETAEILWTLSALLLATGVAITIRMRRAGVDRSSERQNPQIQATPDHVLIVMLSLTLFFYVGAENTVSGWVISLGNEVGGHQQASSLVLGSLFWFAQTLGRGFAPLALRHVSERRLFGLLTACGLGGIIAMILSPTGTAVGIGVVITGLGLSALFPLTASRLSVAATGLRGGSGWVFALGGIGGAVLPWLTGRFSDVTGRIQTAFLLPLISLSLVLLLGHLTARRQGLTHHR
jgi:fucose permease